MTALHGKDHERGRQPTRSVGFGDGRLTIADRLEHHAHPNTTTSGGGRTAAGAHRGPSVSDKPGPTRESRDTCFGRSKTTADQLAGPIAILVIR
jgi:hypothetical protein